LRLLDPAARPGWWRAWSIRARLLPVGGLDLDVLGAHRGQLRGRHRAGRLTASETTRIPASGGAAGALTGYASASRPAPLGLQRDVRDDDGAGEGVSGANRSAELEVADPGTTDHVPVLDPAVDREPLVDGQGVHAAGDEPAEVPLGGGAVGVDVEELGVPLAGE